MPSGILAAVGDEVKAQVGMGMFHFGITGAFVGTIVVYRIPPDGDDELIDTYTAIQTLVGDCAEDETTILARMDAWTSGAAKVRIGQVSWKAHS